MTTPCAENLAWKLPHHVIFSIPIEEQYANAHSSGLQVLYLCGLNAYSDSELSMAQLMYIGKLYPHLRELKLENLTKLVFDQHSTLLVLPFLNLRSLEFVNCDFQFADNSAEVIEHLTTDLVQYFSKLHTFRWDGMPLTDHHVEKLLKGLRPLRRFSSINLSKRMFLSDNRSGTFTKMTLHHIATYCPNIRYLQLQIWKDLDLKSLVKMLSTCKQLTVFEIFGKLDKEDVSTKMITQSLSLIMEMQRVNCPFKILPKFRTTEPYPPVEFTSFYD